VEKSAVTGVLLAGGRSSRMGGADKALAVAGGRPLLAHVIERAGPQVGSLVINSNRAPEHFEAFGLPIAADPVPGFPGPLAGVLAGFLWSREHHPEAQFVASVPADTPFLPDDLVEKLHRALSASGAAIAIAASNGRSHPVAALWTVSIEDRIADALQRGDYKMHDFVTRHSAVSVEFPAYVRGGQSIDPFFNANTPDDLEAVDAFLSSNGGKT
jgi:molybdenum cofactor guanylyltransferase